MSTRCRRHGHPPRIGTGRKSCASLVVLSASPPEALTGSRVGSIPLHATAKDQRCGSASPQAGRQCPPHHALAIQVAGPVAVLATLSAVAVGVMTSDPSIPGTEDLLASSSSAAAGISASSVAQRGDVVSPFRAPSGRSRRGPPGGAPRTLGERPSERPARSRRPRSRPSGRADTRLWTTDRAQPVDERRGRRPQRRPRRGPREGPGDRPQGRRPGRGRRRRRSPAGSPPATSPTRSPRPAPSLGGQCTNGSSIDAGSPSLYDDPRRGLRQLARDHVVRHLAQRR